MTDNNKEDLNKMLPSVFQQYIAVSKYSRWMEDKQRREIWPEPAQRYVDYVVRPVLEKASLPKTEIDDTCHNIFNAIKNTEVLPSMRMLMTAGPALDRDHAAGYNCFTGDTKVITGQYGSVCLSDIVDQEVAAWDGSKWVKATAKYFGEQQTQRVVFKPYSDRTNHRNTVDVTPNHKWILEDGAVTTNLKVGDKVSSMPVTETGESSVDYSDGVRHGIIFGDGALNKKLVNGNYQHHVRLCGAKAEEMEQYFVSKSAPPSYNGDVVGYWTVPFNCKKFPVGKSSEYYAGFIRGWLLADGNNLASDSPKLDSQFEGAYEWLQEHAAFGGYVVVGIHYTNKPTNYGERKHPLARITLKREKVFVVESIAELDVQDVYCLVVPSTGRFVLSSGLLTGNCSFLAIDCQKSFDEVLYLLACGTGVGFSVERQFINKLPDVPEEIHPTDSTIVVADSKVGWATAFRQLIGFLYGGQVPQIDYSRVRASGERLKTFGGRASGPGPLKDLFEYTIRTFKNAVGRKLNSIECHGIVCKTGEAIVVGGVRRSATISLSNLTDQRMRNAKSGQWWIEHPEYALANNSVAYTEKPDAGIFLEEWKSLYQSRSGERGIFNRQGVQNKAKKIGKRDPEQLVGTNP